MLEKLGAETNTLEHPEMRELYGITKSNETALAEVQHRAEKTCKAGSLHVETLNRLADGLTLLVKTFQDHTSEPDSEVNSALFEFGAIVKKVASIQAELNRVVDNTICATIRVFVKEDIKGAKEAKKRYDSSRATYQTALNDLNALQGRSKMDFKKLSEAEARKEAAEDNFKNVSNEALGVLSETHKLADLRSLQTMIFSWKAFQTYFEEGFRITQQSKGSLEKFSSLIPVVQQAYDAMKKVRVSTGRPV